MRKYRTTYKYTLLKGNRALTGDQVKNFILVGSLYNVLYLVLQIITYVVIFLTLLYRSLLLKFVSKIHKLSWGLLSYKYEIYFKRHEMYIENKWFKNSNQFSSVSQSCPTLCNPMDCSKPGLPFHHQLPAPTQTHIHWVGDAIQLSYLLSSPSLPAFSLSQQCFASGGQSISFSFSINPSNDYSGLISFRIDWLSLLAVQGMLKSFLQYHSSKASVFGTQLSL